MTQFAIPRRLGAMTRLALISLLTVAATMFSAWQSVPMPANAPASASFNDYRLQTRDWLRSHRHFQSEDRDSEIGWNAPAEWRPAGHPKRGILLIHGLGDSPWSFADLGESLARDGFLVRAILLPGHGTRPADLVDVDVKDWRAVVREQAALMKSDVDELYLGGFSTGANLALDYAIDDRSVRGLLLFSPALKSAQAFEWLAPVLALVRPWLHAPDDAGPQQSPLRYLNIPTNGFAQYYQTAVAARTKLALKGFDRPALIVSSEHDSVVDVGHMLRTFKSQFTNADSRMIWYGTLPSGSEPGERVLVQPDRLPQERISEFSHMGVLFSPSNPLYGSEGKQRICYNGQSEDEARRCEQGEQVWYSDWGYREPGKVHARLTFNPYYDWQADVMRSVIAGGTAAGS